MAPILRSLATGLSLIALATGGPAMAQTEAESTTEHSEEGSAAVPVAISPADATLSEDELDTLVAPVALYPDALLAQVFVAATFPLDVAKASRWVEENAALEADARSAAAEAEGWDPSVAVLAAGFPTVVTRMADELDWTENLGNALLAQSEDVLDAVQRMRARADALGNLESNQAQTVTVEGDAITIAPADAQVVYVPQYEVQKVYTAPPPPQPAVVEDDDDQTGALIVTGLLSFGAGMLVNEIFDDDDDWDDYWGPRYPPVNWGGGYFRPRPPGWYGPGRPGRPGGIGNTNIGGDVNINIGNDGRWRADKRHRDRARRDIARTKARGGGPGPGAIRPAGAAPRAAKRDRLRQSLAKRSAGAPRIGRAPGQTRSAERLRDGNRARTREGALKPAGSLTRNKNALSRGKDSRLRATGQARKVNRTPSVNRTQERNRAALNQTRDRPKAKRSAFGHKGGGVKRANRAKARGGKSARRAKAKRR
ncbi:MAG: DUF3300 domain-containing protein [Pseudomonadota bacterium]